MKQRSRSLRFGVPVIVVGFMTASVLAQENGPGGVAETPDWPCQQALVPEIAAAVIWDGPAISGLAWRDAPAVVDLVARVTPPGTSPETAQAAIAAFASGLSTADKDRMLTLAFAGVLDALNQDRRHLIDGIQRYSRDQSRRAEQLGRELDDLVRLERDSSPETAAEAQTLRQRLALEERIFDERERSIQFLCQRPIVVEERLGLLARTIAGYLD